MLARDILARLLARRLGIRKRANVPRLTIRQILAWADEHRPRTGQWPRHLSGAMDGAPGEAWPAIDEALRQGHRGLKGGSSLARLLGRRRGVPNVATLPRLTIRQILRWADAHCRRMGEWPDGESGTIRESRGETWKGGGDSPVPGTARSTRRLAPGPAEASTPVPRLVEEVTHAQADR